MNRLQQLRHTLDHRNVSLSAKVTAMCAAAIVVSLTLAFAVHIWLDWSADRADFARDQLKVAQSLAAAAGSAVEERDGRATAGAEAIFDGDEAAVAASYISLTGESMAMARPGETAGRLKALGVAQAQIIDPPGSRFDVHVPVFVQGRRTGELVLIATEAEIEAARERNMLSALTIVLLGATLSGLGAQALVRALLGPLGELERAVGRVARTKNFAVRVTPRSNDELGRLTRGFNALLGELSGYDGDLRRVLADLTVAKDAAEDANVMKSQFLANMSHEIRTPLNGVLGMAQVMALTPLDKTQAEQLDVIRSSGAALLSVLNDLLDLSKIEAGLMELEDAPFDLADVAQGAYATFTSIANASGVEFSMSIDDEAQGMWRGDSVRLRQVLYNLISNALKFTSEGEVCVDIRGEPSPAGKALTISIRDTGIGIAADVLPKLFHKFVQADSSTTRRFGGTGLGLTICKQIVELMGGTIGVESRLGEGATFRVRLPLTWLGPAMPLPSPPVLAERDPQTSLEGLRVLAAEDNATNQLVLKTVLHSLGLHPVIVENGRQAVDAWAREHFDLVLMDIQMPQMDGLAATAEIRRREAAAGVGRTPIVALSANVMKDQVAEYLAAGMDAHLGKPIQIAELYRALLAVRAGRASAAGALEAA
jgi:signal transduction histidine kinase/AmiR/NasT family two-component response regulator